MVCLGVRLAMPWQASSCYAVADSQGVGRQSNSACPHPIFFTNQVKGPTKLSGEGTLICSLGWGP